MKRATSIFTVAALVALLAGSHGCATRAQTGAVVGAGAGAVVGGVIGHAAGNTAVGAIIGATVGGAAGAIIGHYMDEQAEEMERDLEGARIERVGEGIKITFQSGLLFDVNRADLRPVAKGNLDKLAGILNKYEDTNILIEGHTDATGPEDYNMDLSWQRAQSVSHHLATLNVSPSRFSVIGYGETQPVATNDTPEGRQLNRRVELAIIANEKLKKAAMEQAKEG
ncbi:MAG: OmpA family protein [Gemmatimonadota bacterium]|nr:MAG: OmpA family protein [Gemmatimonadota bacterium]